MKYLLGLNLVLLGVHAYSQLDREKEDLNTEVITNYTHVPGFGSKVSYGLQAELMLSGYFGFQASAAGNKDYVSFNGVVLLVPLGILAFDKDMDSGRDFIQLTEILFWATLVENPTLHVPIGDRLELVAYASLCRVRYWWNEQQPFASPWIASGSLGVKAGYFFAKNWYVNLGAEYTQLYYSGRPKGFQIGISLGKVKKPK